MRNVQLEFADLGSLLHCALCRSFRISYVVMLNVCVRASVMAMLLLVKGSTKTKGIGDQPCADGPKS